jgi:hypothetical protein
MIGSGAVLIRLRTDARVMPTKDLSGNSVCGITAGKAVAFAGARQENVT